MFRDKRWFVFDCKLTDQSIRENNASYLRVIRYYRTLKLKKAAKIGVTDFNEAMRLPLNLKNENDIVDLIYWYGENMPFESRRGDWIKDNLWALIDDVLEEREKKEKEKRKR